MQVLFSRHVSRGSNHSHRRQVSIVASLMLCALSPIYAAGYPDWMGTSVTTGTYLSDLTIPGTHDSAALKDGSAPEGTAKAQNVSLAEQLNLGVRYLDIRLNFLPDHGDRKLLPGYNGWSDLYTYHGLIQQTMSAEDVLKTIKTFLDAHPKETVLMSVKYEAQVIPDNQEFQKSFEKLMTSSAYKSYFYQGNTVPQYGADTRKKIVLIRRYPNTSAHSSAATLGIDGTNWPNNSSHAADNKTLKLWVEDAYGYECSGKLSCSLEDADTLKLRDKKWIAVSAGLDRALKYEGDFDRQRQLNIVFASATVTPSINPVPTKGSIPFFSAYINPKVKRYADTHRGRAGVVVLDRADQDTVRSLIVMNNQRPFEVGTSSTKSGSATIEQTQRQVKFTLTSGATVNVGGQAVGRPGTALGAFDETSIFVVGADRGLWTAWQSDPLKSPTKFTGWVSLGGQLSSNPVAVRNCSKVMEVFARGMDDAIWTTRQKTAGGTWAGWTSIGGIARGRPMAEMNNCNVKVSVIGADGQSWSKTRTGTIWSAWVKN